MAQLLAHGVLVMTPARIPVLCVHGTWGADFTNRGRMDWWQPGSPFHTHVLNSISGCDGCYFDPFVWSGEVNGTGRLWPWNWFRTREEMDWLAGARSLTYLLSPKHGYVDVAHRNIIAHSHGGQVVLHAAAAGLQIRSLITVGTPVREDMKKTIDAAVPNIGYWLHLYDPDGDRMQLIGGIGDGHLGFRRVFPQADRNEPMPGGHSGILHNQALFPLWTQRGWLNVLKGSTRD